MPDTADRYWIHDDTGSYCVRYADAYAEYVELMEQETYEDSLEPPESGDPRSHKDHHQW